MIDFALVVNPTYTLPASTSFVFVHVSGASSRFLPVAGAARCLDAFTVALNQACQGREKHWYVSTLELQLASLEFCKACRSVPTLHVSVNDRTPVSLWSPSKAHTGMKTSSSKKVRLFCRISVVRALRLTWQLPLDWRYWCRAPQKSYTRG